MSFDPEILLGLQNSRQNQSSLELQREILAMQKLQVLNQVRISQGLLPLTELPKPPPESKKSLGGNPHKYANHAVPYAT
jgi:hypothetical protein